MSSQKASISHHSGSSPSSGGGGACFKLGSAEHVWSHSYNINVSTKPLLDNSQRSADGRSCHKRSKQMYPDQCTPPIHTRDRYTSINDRLCSASILLGLVEYESNLLLSSLYSPLRDIGTHRQISTHEPSYWVTNLTVRTNNKELLHFRLLEYEMKIEGIFGIFFEWHFLLLWPRIWVGSVFIHSYTLGRCSTMIWFGKSSTTSSARSKPSWEWRSRRSAEIHTMSQVFAREETARWQILNTQLFARRRARFSCRNFVSSRLPRRCMKTIERAHSPKRLWERVELPANKETALKMIEENLQYWPAFLVDKNRKRFLRIREYLKRMRKIRMQGQ